MSLILSFPFRLGVERGTLHLDFPVEGRPFSRSLLPKCTFKIFSHRDLSRSEDLHSRVVCVCISSLLE